MLFTPPLESACETHPCVVHRRLCSDSGTPPFTCCSKPPACLFTTLLLLSFLPAATLAVGVAAAGLLCMFQVGSWIAGAAQSLRHLEQPALPAPPPKSLAELIEERKVGEWLSSCLWPGTAVAVNQRRMPPFQNQTAACCNTLDSRSLLRSGLLAAFSTTCLK